MALTPTQQIRLLIQDNTPGLYIISDDELQYLLDSNNQNVAKASLAAARIVLFNLAQRGNETVDIFSIQGSKAANDYRLALQDFLRDPMNNPNYSNLIGWVGGVSRSEMEANDSVLDNNIIQNPALDRLLGPRGFFDYDDRRRYYG